MPGMLALNPQNEISHQAANDEKDRNHRSQITYSRPG